MSDLFKTSTSNSDSKADAADNDTHAECPKNESVESPDSDCEADDANDVQNANNSDADNKPQTEHESGDDDDQNNETDPANGFSDFMFALLEQSFTNRIKVIKINNSKYALAFPMYKTSGGIYEVFLNTTENGFYYLSDEGATFETLDEIFEMSEADVQKNIAAILNQYGCKTIGTNVVIECNPYDVHVKMSYLIQAISFMLNMKIFYV
jgi:hypothetical protein